MADDGEGGVNLSFMNQIKKVKTKKNRLLTGFTLIELLVVIAIIGILSSVILVNLALTRNKAKDSAIKSEMGQIRTAVEIFNISKNPNTYIGACDANTDCAKLEADITGKQGGSALVQNFSVTKYCVQYDLNAGGGKWCIDSTGYAGATNISCDATNFNCVP